MKPIEKNKTVKKLKVWVGMDAAHDFRRFGSVITFAKRSGFKSRVRATLTIESPPPRGKARRR